MIKLSEIFENTPDSLQQKNEVRNSSIRTSKRSNYTSAANIRSEKSKKNINRLPLNFRNVDMALGALKQQQQRGRAKISPTTHILGPMMVIFLSEYI